jgi:hypothetical protein
MKGAVMFQRRGIYVGLDFGDRRALGTVITLDTRIMIELGPVPRALDGAHVVLYDANSLMQPIYLGDDPLVLRRSS